MSSLAPTKRELPTNSLPSRTGVIAWLTAHLTTTVGMKIVVAITGTMLVGFVIAHMVGNLKIFEGRAKINDYAAFLKSLGPLLWAMRLGLLAVFFTHILLALALKKRSLDARPIPYAHPNTIQATFASVTMVQTGLLIFLFVAYHIAHFTLGWTQSANGENFLNLHEIDGRHDVYRMIVAGFSNPFVSLLYIAAQIVLFVHLSHGIPSTLQTLGLNTPRTAGFFRMLGIAVAGVVLIGNCSIVAAVWFEAVR